MCSYCLIPSIRGGLVSKPPREVVDECRALADRGVGEVTLVAQDLGGYGHDLGIDEGLARLVEDLSAIDSVE
jgi:tRNA A37 methylthiotransferase MiaB